MSDSVRVLIPSGLLGFGYDKELFRSALEESPDVIAADGGSADPGPAYLGSGKSFMSRRSTKADTAPLLEAAIDLQIPLIVTSAGGAGAQAHLEWMVSIVREIARENRLSFALGIIAADIDKDYLASRARSEIIHGLGHVDHLSPRDVHRSAAIVGQMGWEPIVQTLKAGAQVVIAGRACDEVGIAAYPIYAGFPKEHALAMGKVTECGSDCLEIPMERGGDVPVFGEVEEDGFIIRPASTVEGSRATVASVCKHMLYEERDPLRVAIPGGVEDSSLAAFHQLDEGTVRVRGTRFVLDPTYKVKLEGSAFVGYRCISIAGVRSNEMIAQIDHILHKIRDMVRNHFSDLSQDNYQLHFRVYGKNAVMGSIEPERDRVPHELGIVVEAVAKDQDTADSVCKYVTGTCLLHMWYENNRSGCSGNIAVPFSPEEIGRPEAYEWSVYHLLEVSDPLELFPSRIEQVG